VIKKGCRKGFIIIVEKAAGNLRMIDKFYVPKSNIKLRVADVTFSLMFIFNENISCALHIV